MGSEEGCGSAVSIHVGSTAAFHGSEQLVPRVDDVHVRMVNWPMRSCGENIDSPFSIVNRPGLYVRLGDEVSRIE